jgi:serine/threonine protein kinase/Flp pilus assembly protein TadD
MINRTISHYKIVAEVGRGSMGVVYKARDTKLNRTVAMKFLAPSTVGTAEDRARFMNEARSAAAVSHPNICTIYEIDEAEGHVFISMEFVDGRSLELMLASGPLEVAESLKIVTQIAEGLNEAHEKGVIHRDIKPGNIMVTGRGQAKIMDFGVAKSPSTSSITKAGTAIGTIAYMSPEQARGEALDHRTDIWSLGVVFYEMLAGVRPFRGDYEQSIIYGIQNEDPPPPMTLNPGVPMGLSQMTLNMIVKDRDLRIQNAKKLIEALRDVRARIERGYGADGEKTIAVLPFKNISSEKESDYFSDGLTEELLINLSRLKDMKVTSRTSSMQYKGATKDMRSIGRELGVRYILEGSVRRYGDDLRISVQLIDVASDAQLWAQTYKGRLADVFDIQENVSRQIVDALRLQLTPTERVVLSKRSTLNAEAFDLCLRARDFLYQTTKSKLRIAIDLFSKAIEIDPRYADAYAGLGETYATLYQNYDRSPGLLDQAIESSLKAIMYDPSLSEAHAALSLSYFHKGNLDQALEEGQKAVELNPDSFVGHWILGRIYHTSDRDKDAAECFEKVIALNPDFYTAYMDLRMCYERLGDSKNYRSTVDKALFVYPRYLLKHPEDARAHMFYATDLAQAGQTGEAKSYAEKALELSPGDPLMLYNGACFYARMGDSVRAVESLRAAVEAGFENFEWIKRDADLESIRSDPGYIELVKRKL